MTAVLVPVASQGQVRHDLVALPMPGSAVQIGYDDLEQVDQRRLDFYAEKLVTEVMAAVEASQTGDASAFSTHGAAVHQIAQRFLRAADKADLTEAEADLLFHERLIAAYKGPLPDFMVTSTGPAGIRVLMSVMLAPAPDSSTDYVDVIRDAGIANFD